MTYLKVQMLGAIAPSELFSCTICYRFASVFGTVMSQAMLESAAARLVNQITATTMGANLRSILSTAGSITGWKISQHEENEKVVSVGQANYPAPLAGIGAPSKTPQDSVVISLRTGTPGARGRGRIYVPALAATLGTGFKFTAPGPAAMAADAKALFKLIGDQLNLELAQNSFVATVELAVRSVTAHECFYVNRLQVGDILDTQRRRRDALPEAYVSTSYP